ncbi:energy-coupling factor ABC transporter permease [Thermosediminibacter litoriperuensis]|uniref:Cobalt/nickel transport system permease protein n=1 Tax=Thermosediminibacter litoriperuensis TaxID=291989 RepID=A0A5S5AZH4_9FIRM|nr:energy-coupling factor ABC transporter permease [Thermosediminibacter litoriperuensis]TYP57877.1 cobalt/nickel transport system permease protein [Thermosediminibacter litoriperuensis]
MHIPDGFLDAKTVVATAAASAFALKHNMAKVKEELNERELPALGVMAAFIFAAQMVNFPVMAGTSGHLLGAALAAVLVGPYSAGLILTTVLIVQCLFFQDGGLTALGANILNIAVAAPFVAQFVYNAVRKFNFAGSGTAATFLSAWFSVMAAAFLTSAELALSGTVRLGAVLTPMMIVHAVIGIGEGLITCAAVAYVGRVLNLKAKVSMNPDAGGGVN